MAQLPEGTPKSIRFFSFFSHRFDSVTSVTSVISSVPRRASIASRGHRYPNLLAFREGAYDVWIFLLNSSFNVCLFIRKKTFNDWVIIHTINDEPHTEWTSFRFVFFQQAIVFSIFCPQIIYYSHRYWCNCRLYCYRAFERNKIDCEQRWGYRISGRDVFD
jgi:hypothetical protein